MAAGKPNTKITAGVTPACAETVAAIKFASQRGPGTTRASGPDNKHKPAVAPTDMKYPTDHASSGSKNIVAITVIASSRSVRVGRPIEIESVATPAITAARTTLGSTRVITTNQIKIPQVTISRAVRGKRRNNGESPASTNATF